MMTAESLAAITGQYPRLRVGVVGDFFLDRYLHIDPSRAEISIETGLSVHNVVGVRALPGAAGTIVNNLVALGVGTVYALGFCGDDGEGYELRRALSSLSGVKLDHLLTVYDRQTPVYCKPLIIEPGQPPRELNRLDTKNWTPTSESLQIELAERVRLLARDVDALILLDQVDFPETGVVTARVAQAAREMLNSHEKLTVLADSRRGPQHFPALGLKMNAAELARMTGGREPADLAAVADQAASLAETTGRPVFVTLAERGIVGALPGQAPEHVAAHPVRGPIDVVGAGDSVTANLTMALAAGASLREAMTLAMAAASLVVHQLGTTGTASLDQMATLLRDSKTGER